MGSQQQFCLRWNNHQVNMLNVFDQLLQNESFVDVTLACDGLSLKAHKVVLSACSPYFQKLLLDNPCQHPIVILKDVNYADLKALVDFMYKGEVNVLQDQLQELLKTAELLKIKGLCEVSPTSSTVDPTCVNLKQITTTATNIINHNSGKDSSSSDQQSLSQISLSPTQGSAIVAPLSSSSTRPALTASPPSKRKRAKPQRKSGSISDTDDNVSMLEIEGPPEIIESKVDVPQASMKMDLSSQSSVRTSMGNGMSIPKEEDDAETSSEQGPPEPKVHEGFSQENDDMNAPSLDPPTLLGMAGFSSSPSHQFNLSLPPGLPSQLSGDWQASRLYRRHGSKPVNWTTADMLNALSNIVEARLTFKESARAFGIPKSTLRLYLRRYRDIGCSLLDMQDYLYRNDLSYAANNNAQRSFSKSNDYVEYCSVP